MKLRITILSVTLLSFIFLLNSCKDTCSTTYSYFKYDPVYLSHTEIKDGLEVMPPAKLKNPGKIYISGNYLFVNDVNSGVHIYDNSNPSSPQNLAFVKIPGNIDIAVKGGTLYADSYVDLVVLDISNPAMPIFQKRVESVFPQRQPARNVWVEIDNNLGIVTEYKAELVTVKEKGDCRGNNFMTGREDDVFTMNSQSGGGSGGSRSNQTSAGGSMARFAINGNYLYTVDHNFLNTFDISNPNNPLVIGKTDLMRGDIETIFPYKQNLFIGAQSGMHIYSISNPASPSFVTTFEHITACDPVVATDKFAYVTLRTGTTCQGNINELIVLNIENINAPQLVKEYPMAGPYGLGVDDDLLFVCDGDAGLKVYNCADPLKITDNIVKQYSGIQSRDVIPFLDVLIMTSKQGIFQYSYSDPENIVPLSTIPVN